MEKSGWIFDKLRSMTVSFYKITKMNGSSYLKIPLRSSAILNFQNDDYFCFIWSILAYFHPIVDSKNVHPTSVSNYRPYFNELNLRVFVFSWI